MLTICVHPVNIVDAIGFVLLANLNIVYSIPTTTNNSKLKTDKELQKLSVPELYPSF